MICSCAKLGKDWCIKIKGKTTQHTVKTLKLIFSKWPPPQICNLQICITSTFFWVETWFKYQNNKQILQIWDMQISQIAKFSVKTCFVRTGHKSYHVHLVITLSASSDHLGQLIVIKVNTTTPTLSSPCHHHPITLVS